MLIDLVVERSNGTPKRYTLVRKQEGERGSQVCKDSNGAVIKALIGNQDRRAFMAMASKYQQELEAEGHSVVLETPRDEPHG